MGMGTGREGEWSGFILQQPTLRCASSTHWSLRLKRNEQFTRSYIFPRRSASDEGVAYIGRRVIQRILKPCCLTSMAS